MKSAARCAWLAAVKIARLTALSTSSQLAMYAACSSRGSSVQIKVGTEERSTEFRHEFFDCVAFGPECVVPKYRDRKRSARPAGQRIPATRRFSGPKGKSSDPRRLPRGSPKTTDQDPTSLARHTRD